MAVGRPAPPPPVTLGVRAPVRIQSGVFGIVNRTAVGVAPNGRLPPAPSVASKGPSQTFEQFTAGEGIPENVARALNALQANIAKSVSQSKEEPFVDGNLIERVTLVAGGSTGAAPYTVIQHGLGKPYRGAILFNTRNGYVTQWAIVANTTSNLDAAQVQLWTVFTNFSASTPTVADVWVYG